MDLRRANTPEPLNMTWAGERGEQHRSFQSPGLFFLLTLPFIERGYRRSPIKRNVKRQTSPPSPMPVLFRRGIQPNCLNVHPRSESGLAQAECPVWSPRAKRRYASSLWFHFAVVTAPVVF